MSRRISRSRVGSRLGRRGRRVVWSLLAILIVLASLWSWFAVTKIYFPRLDPVPQDADVLFQVGGASPPDFPAARDLAQKEGIPDLVISEPTGNRTLRDSYCGPLEGVEVHCFSPDPSTTRGEAQEFGRLAEDNGWDTAMVLSTGREHVERVRLYVERCWDGDLSVNRPASERSLTNHLYQSAYQTLGWARAMTDREC
ncbi:MAG: hypothetical protein ACTH1D_12035 [Mycobacteriaceae bacterium]|uniref:hypothetical protein n=1 Tax=Corynebacterium sp. TaxID=1720 RepID=UPI003F99BC29